MRDHETRWNDIVGWNDSWLERYRTIVGWNDSWLEQYWNDIVGWNDIVCWNDIVGWNDSCVIFKKKEMLANQLVSAHFECSTM